MMTYTYFLLVISGLIQATHGIDFLLRPARNTLIRVGMTVTLRCSFSNKGNTVVYWYRVDTKKYLTSDRNFYEPMPRYRIVGGTAEYSLQITNVQVSDEAEYRCGFFQNNMFTFARSVIVVLVTPAMGTPICSIRHSSTNMLRPGNSVSLICKSSGGRPSATLKWFRGQQSIGVSRISPNEVTTILNPDDNGRKFVCRLDHETLNEPRKCTIMPLKILPVVMVTPDALSVDVGQDAKFRCNAKGIPGIDKITWLINNTVAINGMNNRISLQQNAFVLIIKNATLMDDHSTVTCKATTPLGLNNSDSGILFVIKGYKPTTTFTTTQPVTADVFTTMYEEKGYLNAQGNNTAEIFGAIFGAVIAFLIVATILYIIVRLCERRKKTVRDLNMSQLRGNGSVYSMTNDYGPAPTVTDQDPNKYKTLGIDGKLPSVYQNLIENSTSPNSVTQVSGFINDGPKTNTLAGGQYYEVVVTNNEKTDNDSINNDYETLGRDSNGIVGRIPPHRYDTPSILSGSNNNNPDSDVGLLDNGTYEIPTVVKSQPLQKSDTLDSKGYVCPKHLYIQEPVNNSKENLLETSCEVGEDYVDMDTKTRSIIYQQSIEIPE